MNDAMTQDNAALDPAYGSPLRAAAPSDARPERGVLLAEHLAVLDGLEPDAIRVLTHLARRLKVGRKTYGDLDLATDPRDMRKARSEEIEDMLVYSSMAELMSLAKSGKLT